MAIIRSLDGFLRKPTPGVGAILIYGGDPAAIRDVASRAVERLAGSLDDPFNVAVLDEAAISADIGRVVDEVQSQSLLGGSRVVWVRGAEQHFLKAVEAVLSGSVKGNVIVAEAGNLAKGTALRARFEESEHVLILPVYEASSAESATAAAGALERFGLRIGEEALALLVELAGGGGAVLAREVEKLASYCLGASSVVVDDVRAICGISLEVEADDLVDAVLGGDVVGADRFFLHMTQSGVDAGRVVSATHSHVVRLIDCRRGVDRGTRVEQAVKSARPPFFFKRQPAVQSQLKAWEMESLLAAAASLGAAILQIRLNPYLGDSLANRALLAVARSARAHRLRLN
jgi:DNA polymerase III subunit delta